jgi:cell shape-determining protein MreC
MAKVFGWVRGLVVIAVIYGLINGGLWLYWNNAHSKEHREYDELNTWLSNNKEKLNDLKSQAESTQDQDEYDQLASEYNDLKDEYNTKVNEYNNDVDIINSEFYLIPVPGKHRE